MVAISNGDILRLAAPISFSLVIPQISFLTNNVFLGQVGERELGVAGITGIYYLMLVMIGSGMSNGMQIQVARRAGEGDAGGIAKVFANSILLSLFLALSLMLLTLWLVPVFFGMTLHDDVNMLYSISFLYIRVWGLPFIMLTQLCNAFYISVGRSGMLVWQAVAATVMTILFDYLLIFGKGGFPVMGLEGAAIAAVLGELTGCLVAYGMFYMRRLYRQYSLHRYLHFDAELSLKSLRIAAPLIVQFLFSIGGWELFFIYVEHLGNRELAASQILRSIFGIVGVVTWAFAASCSTMVSHMIGQGRDEDVLPLIRRIAKLSLLTTSVIGVLLLLFPGPFLALYRNDPALVQFAIPSLRVIVAGTLLMSVSTVVFNGVVGTGRTMVNLVIEVSCVMIYLAYCYVFIERLRSPLPVAWASDIVYWLSLIICSSIYLKSGRWRGKKI